MTYRSYGHFCGLAHALDIVGDRWTLLLIRELLTGPKRNRDFLHRLPGLGSSLLSRRLQHLVRHGLIASEAQPPPASTTAYILTERGWALEPLLLAMTQWGFADVSLGGALTSGAFIGALQANVGPAFSGAVAESYEFRVADDVFHLHMREGRAVPVLGPARNADCVVQVVPETLQALMAGTVNPRAAQQQGHLQLSGSRDACHRCLTLLDFAPLRRGRRLPVVDLTSGRIRPFR